MSSALLLDTSTPGPTAQGNASSFSANFSTTGANRLAILCITLPAFVVNAPSVLNIQTPGIIWTKLSASLFRFSVNLTTQANQEVWSAAVSGSGSYTAAVTLAATVVDFSWLCDTYYFTNNGSPILPIATVSNSVYSGFGIDPIGSITPAYNNSYIATYLASWGGGFTESPLPGYVSTSNVVINGDNGEISGQYSTSSYAAGVAVTPEFVTGRADSCNNITSVCLNCPQPPTILFDGNLVIGCGNVQSYEINGTPLAWEIKWGAIDGTPTCTLDNGTLVVGTLIGIINAPGAVIGNNLLYAIGNIGAPVSVLDYYAPLPNNLVGACQVSPISTVIYTITAIGPGGTSTAQVTITIPSVLVCLWLNPTALVCSDFYDGSELSWLVVGGTSQSIDQGIGAVASTGSTHVSTSVGETWTLTAQPGSEQATATLTVDPSVALPSVDGAPVLWGGGQTYLAGPYLITCCGGGYEYNPAGYSAGYGYTINGDVDYDNGPGYAVPSRGFRLFSGTVKPPALGQRFLAPGLRSNYPSAAACTTANAGQQNIFYHSGGVISLYLEDFPYWDNVLDSTMPVSFGIAGPGPVISFTESSTGPVNAGTSVTLSWAVQYSASQSIDNGIGAVSATGTTVVNPTVTTTYNLTATGTGITQIASITVYVYVPTAPTNIDMVNACGGEISLVWEPGQYGTSQILQRSTDNATWTTIATLALGVNSYVDTVTRSTQFFYKIINTDGYNPAISASYEASAIALPLAVTNLASTTAGMVVNLSWTPIDGSSYFVYRNGDLCNTLAFVGTSYADSGGLVSGDTYTYMVQSVNQCGETANSVSITATPYYNLNAYTPVTPPTGNWN